MPSFSWVLFVSDHPHQLKIPCPVSHSQHLPELQGCVSLTSLFMPLVMVDFGCQLGWTELPRMGEIHLQGSFLRGLMWSSERERGKHALNVCGAIQWAPGPDGRELRGGGNEYLYTCMCASSVFSLTEFLYSHCHSQTPGSSAFHHGVHIRASSVTLQAFSTWLRLYHWCFLFYSIQNLGLSSYQVLCLSSM